MTDKHNDPSSIVQLQIKRDNLTRDLEEIELNVQAKNHLFAKQQHKTRLYDIELQKAKARSDVQRQQINLEIDTIDKQINYVKNGGVIDKITTSHSNHTICDTAVWPLKLLGDDSAFNLSPELHTQVLDQFFATTGPDHVVSRVQDQSRDVDVSAVDDKYENTVMIAGYSHEDLDRRRQCVRDAISRNINNDHIDAFVLFVYCDNKKIDPVRELFNGEPFANVTIIICDTPPTYQTILSFISEEMLHTTKTCFLLAKSDAVLPSNCDCLKKLNLQNRVVCMSESVKSNYWETDAWLIDSSVAKHKKLGKDLFIGSNTAAELFLHECHQSMISIHNISVGNHVVVEKFDQSDHVNKYSVVKKQPERQWPFVKSVTTSNYVVGDTCGFSKYNFYYDDRFTGVPSKYFTMDIKTLTYEYTSSLCVFYMSCMKEVNDGSLYKSISNFFSKPTSKDKSFDLYICLDVVDDANKIIANVKQLLTSCGGSMVNNVCVQSADLQEEENVFTYDMKKYKTMKQLPLGASNGINKAFYVCLSKMQAANKSKYKYMLMLEADCIAINDYWFDCIYTYCQTNPDVVVAGSKHKGLNDGHRLSYYADHINGVAIYKNTTELTKLLKGGQKYITRWIKDNDEKPLMNFDVGNYLYAKDTDLAEKLVDIDIISNYSSTENTHLTVEQVLDRHPNTVILHKKTPSSS